MTRVALAVEPDKFGSHGVTDTEKTFHKIEQFVLLITAQNFHKKITQFAKNHKFRCYVLLDIRKGFC